MAAEPRRDSTFVEGERRVGDEKLRIHLHARAQARALGAGAKGRVKGEGPGLQLFERQVVHQAGQVLAVDALAIGVPLGQVHQLGDDQAGRQS